MAGFASQISLAGSPVVYRVTVGTESGDSTDIFIGGASSIVPEERVEAAVNAFAETVAQPPYVLGGIARIATAETPLQQ